MKKDIKSYLTGEGLNLTPFSMWFKDKTQQECTETLVKIRSIPLFKSVLEGSRDQSEINTLVEAAESGTLQLFAKGDLLVEVGVDNLKITLPRGLVGGL